MRGGRRATTIYNLLEVCGVLSFNLTHEALLILYAEFSRRYALSVLFPPISDRQSLSIMVRGTFEKITRKMALGDANIRFADLCGLLRHLGFDERIRGSHHLYRREGVEELLNLQREGNTVKPYQVRQVRAVMAKYHFSAT